MPINRDTIISDLSPTTTFYEWWEKENDEIIEKLNLMNRFFITHGQGIGVTSDINGQYILNLGESGALPVTNGLTFSGKVNFDGRTILPNVSFKVTGITLGSVGFTFGTPIFYDDTISGYSAGICTSSTSSEIVGVITERNTDFSVVTVCGKVDGDFTAVNVPSGVGTNLSGGCIYFLSDVLGQITTTEPTTDGYISKPLMIGLGATCGMVFPYRGYQIDSGALSGAGITGSNYIFITIPGSESGEAYNSADGSGGFNIGSIVSYFTENQQLQTYLTNGNPKRKAYSGWFLSQSVGAQAQPFEGGNEEDFVVGTITDKQSVTGGYLYKITTYGSYSTDISGVGLYVLRNNTDAWTNTNQLRQLDPGQSSYNGKLYAIQYDASTHLIVNRPFKSSGSSSFTGSEYRSLLIGASGGVGNTAAVVTENVLLNGDYSIWQRETGKITGYTGTSDVVFADMWRRTDGITGVTKEYRIERKEFTDYQTSIEGNPEYYLQVKAMAATLAANEYHHIAHVIPSAKAHNSQDVVFSFYAKCSHNGYPLDLFYSRYNNQVQADKVYVDTVTLSTTWQRFDITFNISNLSDLGGSLVDDYTEIGFDFVPLIENALENALTVSENIYVDLASVCLFLGEQIFAPHSHLPITTRLNECKKYYYSTYNLNEYPGQLTVQSDNSPTHNVLNHVVLPLNTCNYIKWPFEMRETPTISVYSPVTGAADAFNLMSNRDCRLSSGTFGYAGASRVVRIGQETITTYPSSSGLKICVGPGTVNYDRVFYHIIADADYPLPS